MIPNILLTANIRSSIWTLLLTLCVTLSCKAPPDLTEDPKDTDRGGCQIGAESCPCTQGGACDEGLSCISKMCVRLPDGTGANADTNTDTVSVNDSDADMGNNTDTGDHVDDNSNTDMDDSSNTDDDDNESDTNQFDTNQLEGDLFLRPNEDGWIDASTNALSIQGGWWTDAAPNSTIDMTIDSDGTVCVEGIDGMAEDFDFTTYWGATFGFDLCVVEGDDDTTVSHPISDCPLNPDLGTTFKGIQFDIDGVWENWRHDIRVRFEEEDREEDAYVEVLQSGTAIAKMSSAFIWYADTWDPPEDPMDYPVNIEDVNGIQFQIPSDHRDTTTFSFCISNIEALVQ